MYILGIDTSCDDTSAALVEDGKKILSNIISNQFTIHRKYGGIVPELASRRHIEMIWPVITQAFKTSNISPHKLSGIAVCHGPGLIGSLLIGVSFAKSLSYSYKLPLIGVNHLEGHVLSPFLNGCKLHFPFLALIVSGGHTHLYRVDAFGCYKELGKTRDDAAGEAFDKVATLLGLSYPGGPIIDKLSQKGNPNSINFPRAYLKNSLDFSFSGLKTSVLNYLKSNPNSNYADVAASFQDAVINVLINKVVKAVKKESISRVIISGGVAANSKLRYTFEEHAKTKNFDIVIPPVKLCTDNAAMIAAAGYYHFINNNFSRLDLNPKASLKL
jgi:N6-L-threonylcarbamoyladenine synthase